ncbi:MAG: dihydroneopterin aldolase [Candidatus Syntrophonatronum acetioxidans]|uniref:7,8-dihydroneopterin aldolase n=1 Tax=Candidatus Syntrophonatronum acetioxidans TaxID=1795816 RepID=A0A424YBW6_9FIRM|nr:MAG: dihydroneopterin aldolase [Candidatus Syntrophonatronum acetioxidans]
MAEDKIIMNEMSFYGYHGVLPSEKAQGQKFLVTLEVCLDLSQAGKTDNLKDTIDYASIYKEVRNLMKGKRYNLLETLAENIAGVVLSIERVREVVVKIKKPWAPIPGNLDFVGIEIRRGKG